MTPPTARARPGRGLQGGESSTTNVSVTSGSVAARRALPALVLALVALPLLGGSSCKRGEPPADQAKPTELPKLTEEPAAGDRKPVEGATLDGLKDDEKKRFE